MPVSESLQVKITGPGLENIKLYTGNHSISGIQKLKLTAVKEEICPKFDVSFVGICLKQEEFVNDGFVIDIANFFNISEHKHHVSLPNVGDIKIYYDGIQVGLITKFEIEYDVFNNIDIVKLYTVKGFNRTLPDWVKVICEDWSSDLDDFACTE